MATHKVGIGHDIVLSSLVDITPEPSSILAPPVQREYALSGRIHDYGLYQVLHWDYFESEGAYQTLLALFDLDTLDYSEVTVYTRMKRAGFARYNAIAQLPEGNSDIRLTNFFIRDVNIYLTHLEELFEI